MTYNLGRSSLSRLQGVHTSLAEVVAHAIQITTVDFAVIEGLRTKERQEVLVKSGASKTMDSRHLTGHAVDLAAWVGGHHSWDWPLYYKIAEAMRLASLELSIPIRWGGCWDRLMSEYKDPEEAVAGYIARRKIEGKKAFIDGPHFELPRATYP